MVVQEVLLLRRLLVLLVPPLARREPPEEVGRAVEGVHDHYEGVPEQGGVADLCAALPSTVVNRKCLLIEVLGALPRGPCK